jgi:hypothetical protein
MSTRTITRALGIATISTGLVLGTVAGAQASMTSKTAGCRPAQHLASGYRVISGTATATPYSDRWITRKVSISATKRGHDASSYYWTLTGIKVEGYPTFHFPRNGIDGGNRLTKYLNSTPRDITITWTKDLLIPFTSKTVSCTIHNF